MCSKIITVLVLLMLTGFLIACSSNPASPEKTAIRDAHLLKARADMENAAVTPLNDLNLVHAEIPSILIDAQKAPYAAPENLSCDGLSREIIALDTVLGPDLDAVNTRAKPDLVERGSVAVGKAAIGVLRGVTEGVVPYRRWVRKLSGAERYSKEVSAAIEAGTARRSFLKGMAYATACERVDYPLVESVVPENLNGNASKRE